MNLRVNICIHPVLTDVAALCCVVSSTVGLLHSHSQLLCVLQGGRGGGEGAAAQCHSVSAPRVPRPRDAEQGASMAALTLQMLGNLQVIVLAGEFQGGPAVSAQA